MTKTIAPLRVSALALVAALALAGCGAGDGSSGSSSSSAASSQASSGASSNASGLEVTDPWVKAADRGMTAAFGKIKNTSDHDVTITSAESEASPKVQLHETVMDHESGSSTMQQKKGGFVVKAGETKTLEPGGDHIMFMDLKCSLLSGDKTEITLKTKDGQDLKFTAPIRDYQAAQEHYDPSSGPSDAASSPAHPDHGNGHESMSGMDGMDQKDGKDGMSGMDGMDGASASASMPSCSA